MTDRFSLAQRTVIVEISNHVKNLLFFVKENLEHIFRDNKFSLDQRFLQTWKNLDIWSLWWTNASWKEDQSASGPQKLWTEYDYM